VIVLDASTLVELILDTPSGRLVADRIADPAESLHVPHLVDIEVVQALRRYVREGEIEADAAELALDDLRALDLQRHAQAPDRVRRRIRGARRGARRRPAYLRSWIGTSPGHEPASRASPDRTSESLDTSRTVRKGHETARACPVDLETSVSTGRCCRSSCRSDRDASTLPESPRVM
jgi:predicted nucleic acid-binding protein